MKTLKSVYNASLKAARQATAAAAEARQAVIDANPRYKGSSIAKLNQAATLLGEVRGFEV